eukprot:140254-Chlamydomonas_euryale.AAC.1
MHRCRRRASRVSSCIKGAVVRHGQALCIAVMGVEGRWPGSTSAVALPQKSSGSVGHLSR